MPVDLFWLEHRQEAKDKLWAPLHLPPALPDLYSSFQLCPLCEAPRRMDPLFSDDQWNLLILLVIYFFSSSNCGCH